MATVPPISKLPASKPNVSRKTFAKNTVLFSVLILYPVVCLVMLQIPSLLLLAVPYVVAFAVPPQDRDDMHRWFHRLYKAYIRWTESLFGSIMLIAMHLLAPFRLVVSGDLELMENTAQAVVMSNHQIYPDWCYLWILARRTNHHGNVKIMLMSILQYIPICGIGMTFFEFIFLKRKLSADRKTIINHLRRIKNNSHLPLWLLIFPEGTLNTPNNRETSRAFAKKMELTDDPKIVILPKATGLFMCCDALAPKVNRLFDVTVGYGGIGIEQIPYEEYLPENVFLKEKYPKEVHMHIQAFDTSKLAGFDGSITAESLAADKEAAARAEKQAAKTDGAFDALAEARRAVFSDWVRERFMLKDRLMEKFYQEARFPDHEFGVANPKPLPQTVYDGIPEPLDWIMFATAIVSSFYTIPMYWRIFSAILGVFF